MARNPWFETVAEAQRRAKKRLPPSVYSALLAGSELGITRDDNTAAFGELGFAPHVAGLSGERELSTTVTGQHISMPVMISPTGVQAVHPDGEVAVARAAAARGTAVGLSSFGSKPIEEVAAANPQTFFQMYWAGNRDWMLAAIERARNAGAVGLIVTLDWSFSQGRDWGSPSIPEKMDLKAMVRFAPEAPGATSGGHPHSHVGEECGIVLAGEMIFWVGDDKVRLEAGDAIYLDSALPHQWTAGSSEMLQAVWLITPPTF